MPTGIDISPLAADEFERLLPLIAAYQRFYEVEQIDEERNRTFFRRSGQWVDSQVTKTQEANARRIKQFSDEYFELAQTQGRRLSQYLVFDEPVLLTLDNKAYLIEP